MKTYLYVAAITWLCILTGIGVILSREVEPQIIRDQTFIREEINPGIRIIEKFRKQTGRLPSEPEFEKLQQLNKGELGGVDYIRNEKFLDNEIKSKVADWDWSKNYVLAVWRGEWFEYYLSKNKLYLTNNTKPSDKIYAFLYSLFVGAIPMVILLIFRNKFGKKTVIPTL